MKSGVLDKELDYFDSILDELLGKAENEYALIHGEELIDTFTAKEDALKRGYQLYESSPFLVKQVLRYEEVLSFTSRFIAA
ncbi:MAG: hypothetical protein SFH39_03905 [Candidatus Magnetobacterium sp. LHC-1]|nr:hypothetical protein [Nitrospirota bacterium]